MGAPDEGVALRFFLLLGTAVWLLLAYTPVGSVFLAVCHALVSVADEDAWEHTVGPSFEEYER